MFFGLAGPRVRLFYWCCGRASEFGGKGVQLGQERHQRLLPLASLAPLKASACKSYNRLCRRSWARSHALVPCVNVGQSLIVRLAHSTAECEKTVKQNVCHTDFFAPNKCPPITHEIV